MIVATPAQADVTAYARARAADGAGQVDAAAAGYAEALSDAPDNLTIARRAYREALQAGDDTLARRAAATLERASMAPADAALLGYADAVRTKDAPAQEHQLALLAGTPFDFVVPPFRAWQAYEAGRDPFPLLAFAKPNAIAKRYIAENRALLLIATGRIDEAVPALRALLGTDASSLDLRVNAAQLLAAKGRADLAATLLAGNDTVLTTLRSRLGKDIKPGSAFGVSRLYTRLAGDLASAPPTPLSITLTRAALRVEPGNDRARLLLADALAKDDATDRALATLDDVAPASPYWTVAQQVRITVLQNAGQSARALQVARALSAAKGADSDAADRVADLLYEAGRFDDSAAAYRVAIERAGADVGWNQYLQLGGALDQGGHWPEARAALEKAAELAPNQPVVLNYLGYAQIEHGEQIAASEALLERASALLPDDASVTDSLAWAYFRRGDAKRALPLLERAAQGEPANAVINEHLGDAYWSLGRRYEARYAWRAATVVADAEAGPRLAEKIAGGPKPSARP